MVVAIIASLLGLVLPAVNLAVASSRRTACGNNLKQIGVALQAYANTHSAPSLPAIAWRGAAGTVTGCTFSQTGGSHFRMPSDGGFSWAVQILPFAEQINTFNAIGSLSAVNDQPFASYGRFFDCLSGTNTSTLNSTLVNDESIDKTKISWMVCPARATGGVNERRAQCTYRANGGSNQIVASKLPDDGAMKHASATDGRGYSLDGIIDGLSMTYLVWERNDASFMKVDLSPGYTLDQRPLHNGTPFYCGKVLSVGLYDAAATNLDAAITLTAPFENTGAWSTPTKYSGPNPNSDHPGGVLGILMADGAVRFDSPEITNRAFRAQSTRAKTDLVP